LLYAKFLTGVLPFCTIKERAIEVPLFTEKGKATLLAYGIGVKDKKKRDRDDRSSGGGNDSSASPEPSLLFRLALSVYSRLSTSSALIAHLKSRGIKVVFWVLNDEADFQKAFDLGAEVVMTDYPTKLAAFVERREKEAAAAAAAAAAEPAAPVSAATSETRKAR
jgi:hypothetical protein